MEIQQKPSRYTEEEIERGLIEVALCAGNARRAQRQLKQRGLSIPHQTLFAWSRSQHADRYARIREEHLPRIYAKLAEETEDLARAYAEAEHETLERYRAELSELRAADAASAIRNLATARGISTDKANVLRNRPSDIRELRQPDEIVRTLKRLGLVVEGTAEDVGDGLPPAA